MYTKKDNVNSNDIELCNYVEGYDIHNSLLIKKLFEPGVIKESFKITTGVYRPDIIARQYYGSEEYTWCVVLQVGYLKNFVNGNIIELIPKIILDSIINSI